MKLQNTVRYFLPQVFVFILCSDFRNYTFFVSPSSSRNSPFAFHDGTSNISGPIGYTGQKSKEKEQSASHSGTSNISGPIGYTGQHSSGNIPSASHSGTSNISGPIGYKGQNSSRNSPFAFHDGTSNISGPIGYQRPSSNTVTYDNYEMSSEKEKPFGPKPDFFTKEFSDPRSSSSNANNFSHDVHSPNVVASFGQQQGYRARGSSRNQTGNDKSDEKTAKIGSQYFPRNENSVNYQRRTNYEWSD